MSVNDEQRTKLVRCVKDHFNGNIRGKTLAIWGLSFKPHTDDVREAPALYNIYEFLKAGAILNVHDPEAMNNAKKILGNSVQYCSTAYEAAEQADALVIMTEWPEFRTPDFEMLSSKLRSKLIFDGRNLFDLNQMREHGFTYYSIGRAAVHKKEASSISIDQVIQFDRLKKVG